MLNCLHNESLCRESDITAIILPIPANSSGITVKDRAEQVILKSLFENRPMHLTMRTTFPSNYLVEPVLSGKPFVDPDAEMFVVSIALTDK